MRKMIYNNETATKQALQHKTIHKVEGWNNKLNSMCHLKKTLNHRTDDRVMAGWLKRRNSIVRVGRDDIKRSKPLDCIKPF